LFKKGESDDNLFSLILVIVLGLIFLIVAGFLAKYIIYDLVIVKLGRMFFG